MKQYSSYIFDLYGTLADIRTDEEDRRLWERLSLFYGYQGARYEPEELHRDYLCLVNAKERAAKAEYSVHYAHESYPEIPLQEVFRGLYEAKGVKADEALALHTGHMFRACSTKRLRLYAYAEELLTGLKEAGRGVYLLSNAQRIFTEYELRYLGIYDLFDGILISSDEGCRKPDERFYRILMERYGLRAAECLMIGNDMDTDIAGARKAGMDSFYIHSAISPKGQNDSHRETMADHSMKKMDLRRLYRKLLAMDG